MLVSATACAERITPSKNYVTKKVNVGSLTGVVASKSVTEASKGALRPIGNRSQSVMA